MHETYTYATVLHTLAGGYGSNFVFRCKGLGDLMLCGDSKDNKEDNLTVNIFCICFFFFLTWIVVRSCREKGGKRHYHDITQTTAYLTFHDFLSNML